MRYLKNFIQFIFENINNKRFNSKGLLNEYGGWYIDYSDYITNDNNHEIIKKFKDRIKYEIDKDIKVEDEMNNLTLRSIDYINNNIIYDNKISLKFKDKDVKIILDFDYTKSYIKIKTYLSSDMKESKGTKLINIK